MLNHLVKFVAYQKLLKKINIKPGLFCDVKMQIDARLNYPVTKEEDKSKKRRKILRRECKRQSDKNQEQERATYLPREY